MKKGTIWWLAGLVLGLSGCLKNDIEDEKLAENEQEIQAYIARKNLTVQKTSSGLYYTITQPSGSSRVAAKGEKITFHYVLTRLMDEVVIDSSRVAKNKPITLIHQVQGRPEGLAEGLGLLHEGDRGVLLLPSNLAFGSAGGAALLPYSTVRYDVQVLKIRNEDEQIEDYIRENKIRVDERTESGLRLTYLQRAAAGADTVKSTKSVESRFTGTLLDGTQFQAQATSTYDLSQENSTIKGFREALLKLRVGDRVRAIFPSTIGYGTDGRSPSIQPYSPLVFDIEVISVPK